MKKYLVNILIVAIFLICLFLSDYLFLIFGKTNYHNYETNKIEVSTLQSENKALQKELNQVRSLNGLDNYQAYDILKTEILLRDVYNFHETVTIKYGQDKSLKKGMAIVAENGLVGIIEKVNKKTSVVKLLTAHDSSISVQIGENYGALNSYDQKSQYLIANNFNNYELIMKEEEVYTSGLGLIPQGLYIGKVEHTKDTKENIAQEVFIKSNVDFGNLKYLAIIRGIKNI